MARSPFATGRSPLGKLVGFLVVVALLVLVVKHPSETAGWVGDAFSWAGRAVDGLVEFVRSLRR